MPAPSLSPEARSLRASIGAHSLHSKYDANELTKPGRAAQWQKYLDEVDPDRVLPEAERVKRAEHARAAHMRKLALRSAKVRAARKAAAT